MTERTESLIERSAEEDVVPGPAGSDVLSDALNLFRVTGAALLRGEFTAPSTVDVPTASSYARVLHPGATRLMVLHIIAEGTCWVEAEGVPRTKLPKGSIVSFPLGHPHRLSAGEGANPVHVSQLLPTPPWTELPVLRNGGGGEPTRLVCVYLRCDELLSNPIFDSLPPLLIVEPHRGGDGDWIAANVEHIVREASVGRPGGGCLIARLTELLFIEILRRHIASLKEGGTGWLAALGDRHLARALACFHGDPGRQWTLDEVARRAGMSRTGLIEGFQRVLATSPMHYLTMWRLQLAAQALATTHKTMAQIADEVGYGSEVALSRAFKRETGYTPAEWRHQRSRSA
jgi:AraC-like DNA-binding protein